MRAIGVRPYFFAAASEAMINAAAPSLTPEALPAVTVPPSFLKGVPSLASVFDRRRARMLVLVNDDRVALALRNGDGGDFLRQPAVFLRGSGLGLAADGKGVLVFAR